MGLSIGEYGCLVMLATFLSHTFLSPLAAIVICNSLSLAFYLIAKHRLSYWKRNGIQGPSQLPFCGDFWEYLNSFGKTKYEYQKRWIQKYGKIYGYYGGDLPILVIADRELANQIYKTFPFKEQRFENDINGRIDYRRTQPPFKYGTDWSNFITFIAPWLNSNSVKQMFSIMNHHARKTAKQFSEEGSKGTVKAEKILWNHLLNLYCELYTAKSPADLGINDKNLNSLTRGQDSKLFILIKSHFPNIARYIEYNGLVKLTNRTIQSMMEIFHERVDDILQSTEENMSDKVQISFLGTMIKKINAAKHYNQPVPSHSDLVGNFLTFENTRGSTICLTALLYELAKQQDIQDKCREECLQMFQMGKATSWENISEAIPLLIASIYEAGRIHPLNASTIRVCHLDNYVLEGIPIPKGAIFDILICEIMNTEEYFPRANEFLPQRFIETSSEEHRKNGYWLFGNGARKCSGEKLVMSILALTAAHLLSEFEFNFASDNEKFIIKAIDNSAYVADGPAYILKKIKKL